MNPPGDADPLWRLVAVAAIWVAAYAILSAYGVHWVPLSLARHLTLQAFLGLVQLATLGIGLGAAFALLRDPGRVFPLRPDRARQIGVAALLTPAVFSLVTTAAFLIARPTLLAELMAGGRAAVQQNTGRFGRELVHASALVTLVWGALIAPLVEELFFRGILFTTVVRVVRSGLVAALIVAALFGWLHWDMPGGLGIVRLVSALGLGLAAGVARSVSGSVGPAIVVHALFNLLSVASARRWVVTETFPTKYSAPTLVTALGAVTALAAVFWWWRGRRRPRAELGS